MPELPFGLISKIVIHTIHDTVRISLGLRSCEVYRRAHGECEMKLGLRMIGFVLIALSVYAGGTALAADTQKRGGTLTYLIPTDSPPSFDGHREWTFATAHTATPFYSVLIQVNPENLSSATDFVC